MPNKKKCQNYPYLKLYFDLNDNLSIFAKNIFGSSIIETINGNLFNQNNINIGRFAITNTIYDLNDTNQSGLFEVTSTSTFFLQKGNIQYTTSHQIIKDSQGNYIFPDGKSIFKILSGTGIFLNAKGYVVIYSKNTTRKVCIYFTNLKI
jgi:hypothetical protein